MNETIILNMENLTETEREQLLALVEKANKPKKKRWEPESEERFWAIDITGKVYEMLNRVQLHTDNMISIGNCFKTKEEADFAAERLKVIKELNDFADEDTYWRGEEDVCVLFYNFTWKKVVIESVYGAGVKGNDIYFRTPEEAKNAIETVGEERIIKYYFTENR